MKYKSYKDARINRLVAECESKTRLLDGLLTENIRLRKMLMRGKKDEKELQ
jgi:hypothetical protein